MFTATYARNYYESSMPIYRNYLRYWLFDLIEKPFSKWVFNFIPTAKFLINGHKFKWLKYIAVFG